LPLPFDLDLHTVNDAEHRHIDFTYILKSDTDQVQKEANGAGQVEWLTLEQITTLSPMPKKIYSNAKYALKKAGMLQ
jgi:hypothetical protein